MKNKVTFLRDTLAVDDGKIYPKWYYAGDVVEIGADLTATLLSDGAIELVIEEKAVDEAPQNKALHHAPRNKKRR
jgi:hypothetical protein